jgi:hypothetical protein
MILNRKKDWLGNFVEEGLWEVTAETGRQHQEELLVAAE